MCIIMCACVPVSVSDGFFIISGYFCVDRFPVFATTFFTTRQKCSGFISVSKSEACIQRASEETNTTASAVLFEE